MSPRNSLFTCLLAFSCTWLSPLLTHAEAPFDVRKLDSLYGKPFEAAAREALERSIRQDSSASLQDMVRLCGAIFSRGGADTRELRTLCKDTFIHILSSPDLATRYSFRDVVALWAEMQQQIRLQEMRDHAAAAVERLGHSMDEEKLCEAFLAVSPANVREPKEMEAQQIRERELDRVQREILFWLLSDRWLEHQVTLLGRVPDPRFRCPEFSGNVPAQIINELSPECAAAWQEAVRFQRWQEAQPKDEITATEPDPKAERADVGTQNFDAAIDKFFGEPNALTIRELSRICWTSGFWCGTGDERFNAVHNRLKLMIEVRDRRMPQALLALFADRSPLNEFYRQWRQTPNWRIELLKMCGLNWEKLLASAMLPYELTKHQGRVASFSAEQILAVRGSTFAASVLLSVERQALAKSENNAQASKEQVSGVQPRRSFQWDSIARFITPGDVTPSMQPEVDPAVQRELLELILADLRSDKDYISLANSLEPLARLRRPEIKEVIRPLLASRFDYVALKAAAAMEIMGEKPDRVGVRPTPRFQVILNGERWTFISATFPVIHYETKADGWGINNFLSNESRGAELTFDRDGTLAAAEKMTSAKLVVRPASASLASFAKPTLSQPWFVVPINLPISFETINEVRVTTRPLEIRLKYPRPLTSYKGQQLNLELSWLDEPFREKREPSIFSEEVRESYTFAALQPGRYQLAVVAPGAARQVSEVINVREGMQPVTIDLSPASDLHAKIVLPEFAESDELPLVAVGAMQPQLVLGTMPMAKLYRGGEKTKCAVAVFDSKEKSVKFPNVPPGRYTLRVLGEEDWREESATPLKTESGELSNAGWQRTEIQVQVRNGSPPVINIGEVRLKKVHFSAGDRAAASKQ